METYIRFNSYFFANMINALNNMKKGGTIKETPFRIKYEMT